LCAEAAPSSTGASTRLVSLWHERSSASLLL
jgi:hypothetical protein